jgi:hypothetical protein
MNEKALGEALLAWDAVIPPTDPRAVTRMVLERDRRRVSRLTVLTVVLWLLAFVGVVAMVWFHFVFLQPRLWHYAQTSGSRDVRDWLVVAELAAKTVFVVAATVLLAALSTVGLVFSSRRATLRQVNANLAEVAEQLKQLRQELAGRAAPTG